MLREEVFQKNELNQVQVKGHSREVEMSVVKGREVLNSVESGL